MTDSPKHDMEHYVPHRGRMCVLDRIVSWDSQRILAETSFANRDYGVRSGLVLESFQVECVAQAAAALMGLLSEAPRPGMLVSVNNFVYHRCVTCDALLSIQVLIVRSLEGFLFIDGCIRQGEGPVADGSLTLYLPGKEDRAVAPHSKD